MTMSQNDIGPSRANPQLNGRAVIVGNAKTLFTVEQLDENRLRPDDQLLIIRVDQANPGNVPVGCVWEETVQITWESQT